MRTIPLNAKTWQSQGDVYDALLTVLESYEGHGHNFNALWDSLCEGVTHDLGPDPASYLNGVQPPFHIDVANADVPPSVVREMLADLVDLFAEVNAKYGLQISISLRPALRAVKEDAIDAQRPQRRKPPGLTDGQGTIEEIANVIAAAAPKPERPATYKKRSSSDSEA